VDIPPSCRVFGSLNQRAGAKRPEVGPLMPTYDHPAQVVSAEVSMNPARVVSIHFPKAAGSSLRVQFVKLLGDSVALDYTHDPLTSTGREAAEWPTDLLARDVAFTRGCGVRSCVPQINGGQFSSYFLVTL
jgi:hypothetical protein